MFVTLYAPKHCMKCQEAEHLLQLIVGLVVFNDFSSHSMAPFQHSIDLMVCLIK